MAKDMKENPLNESEEFDFQSDNDANIFGKPEIVVYKRYKRKYRSNTAKITVSRRDHIRGLIKKSKIRRKLESKTDNEIK